MESHQLINQTSGEVEFYTPTKIVNAARLTMGSIDLDPASSVRANDSVLANTIFTKEDDGLSAEWWGHIWMNHPFGRGLNEKWINKLVGEYEAGRATQACCITFASTSEAWFRPLLKRPQCFLVPRTNYLLPDGTVYRGVTKGSAVTYFGPNVDRFGECFKHLGEIKLPWKGGI